MLRDGRQYLRDPEAEVCKEPDICRELVGRTARPCGHDGQPQRPRARQVQRL